MKQIVNICFIAPVFILISSCALISEIGNGGNNESLAESLRTDGIDAVETDRGLVIHFPNINFEFNSAELKVDALQQVADIATHLNHTHVSHRKIAVEGHTDSVGSSEFNLKLSKQRAQSVSTGLITRDVSSERIEAEGYGESAPIAPNRNSDGSDNPEGRAKNRRVEIVLLN